MRKTNCVFIDFSEEVGKIRVNIQVECERLMKNFTTLDVPVDGSVRITDGGDGIVDIDKINYINNTITLNSINDIEYDFADLETDDMVAVYEYIYNVIIE